MIRGVVKNPYGQPDRKKTVFFTTPLRRGFGYIFKIGKLPNIRKSMTVENDKTFPPVQRLMTLDSNVFIST